MDSLTAREEQAFAIIALIVVFFALFVDVTEAEILAAIRERENTPSMPMIASIVPCAIGRVTTLWVIRFALRGGLHAMTMAA